MKFLLAIFALTSGLVGALEDCAVSPCTPDPDCPPTFEDPASCQGALGCLVTGAMGVTACGGGVEPADFPCLCKYENRETLFGNSLDCLQALDPTDCPVGSLDDVLAALLEFCGEVDECYGPYEDVSPKSTKGGKGSSAKRLGGSSAKRLNGTSSSAAV